MRKLELRTGAPIAHRPAGPGRVYWIKGPPSRDGTRRTSRGSLCLRGRSVEGQTTKPTQGLRKGLFFSMNASFTVGFTAAALAQ